MLQLAYGMLAMLPVALWAGRVRDGDAMTASSTAGADMQVPRASNGKPATPMKRRRAKRAQRRREQREFRVWLQITAEPLW